MRTQPKAFVQVQSMSRMAGIAGIQMHGATAVLSGMCNQPIQQHAGETVRPFIRQGREIVDIEHLAPSQKFGEAKAGRALNLALLSQRKNPIGLLLLAPDLRQEVALGEVRPQMAENGKAGLNLFVRVGDEQVWLIGLHSSGHDMPARGVAQRSTESAVPVPRPFIFKLLENFPWPHLSTAAMALRCIVRICNEETVMKFTSRIVLATLAAAGLATAVAAAPSRLGASGLSGGPELSGSLMRAARELNLTDNQKQAMRDLLRNARDAAVANRAAQPYDITVLGDPGNSNYAAAVDNAKTQAAARIQRASELQLQVYNLLTPEQKAQLPKVLADMKAEREARRAERQQRREQRQSN